MDDRVLSYKNLSRVEKKLDWIADRAGSNSIWGFSPEKQVRITITFIRRYESQSQLLDTGKTFTSNIWLLAWNKMLWLQYGKRHR